MARLSELGIDFDHWCFACGRANPYGLHLDFDVARGRAETTLVSRREHTGYDGFVHGGIVTARIAVTFRRPVRVDEELRVVGEVARMRSRAIETRGTVSRASDGAVLAEADATFLVMPEDRRRELERRYSGTDAAFARVREAVEQEHAEHSGGREHLRT